jgi:hypothetical protein
MSFVHSTGSETYCKRESHSIVDDKGGGETEINLSSILYMLSLMTSPDHDRSLPNLGIILASLFAVDT